MIVAKPKTDEQLGEEAVKIVQLIVTTQIEQRADLFNKIAYDLKFSYSQGFTARLFESIADMS